MTNKEFFKKVNETAKENVEKALGMIEGYNMINGTNYTMLNKRVVFKNSGDFYYHDAFVWAE